MGVDEKDWVIRIDAMSAALNGKDRKAKKKARKVLTQLLESADETEREHGVKLLTQAYSKRSKFRGLKVRRRMVPRMRVTLLGLCSWSGGEGGLEGD